jgi:hypothetical protein
MKRLTAYLSGKVEAIRVKNREKKVDSALNAATINFEEQRDNATLKIGDLTASLADCESVTNVIQEISEQIDIKEEAERGIERVNKIREYFNEEVEVEEK